MSQKTQFIADFLRQSHSITELCLHYGISRKTAYKWISRYHDAGPAGLQDRSRKPKSCPHQTETELVEARLESRRRHPTWGAKKLLKLLSKSQPERDCPARSTLCDLLARHGLIKKPRQRRHLGHPGKPSTLINAPDQVWCADFKGQFKTRDGLYCYPLTISDGFSRYLLAC
ncbi:MAG TPA: helix-turn-helix domain-containing protein [Blastocatellia bacterium]|nr:helix-turn-helix domain-containing protein [Blastocatellia bacterium]